MMFSGLSLVTNALINISSPKLNNQFLLHLELSQSAWICFWVKLNNYGWIILQMQTQKIY